MKNIWMLSISKECSNIGPIQTAQLNLLFFYLQQIQVNPTLNIMLVCSSIVMLKYLALDVPQC